VNIGRDRRDLVGAHHAWNGERIAQGRENACRWMQENPKIASEIRATLVEVRKAENAAVGAEAVPATATLA